MAQKEDWLFESMSPTRRFLLNPQDNGQVAVTDMSAPNFVKVVSREKIPYKDQLSTMNEEDFDQLIHNLIYN